MKIIIICCFTIAFILNAFIAEAQGKITLTDKQLEQIGQKIFQNETGGNPEFLVAWNDGEAFASLGIGHFIWFPEGLDSRFTETFPSLLQYFKENNVDLPEWLENTLDCPWQTKQEFLSAKNTPEYQSLKKVMADTFALQVNFIHQRMQKALPLMQENIDDRASSKVVEQRFNQLAYTEIGMYSLIDYVNFKGEGTSQKERYNGYGWGLKQVLLEMDVQTLTIHEAFAQSCIDVLTRRINNSPQKDVEMRWLQGWTKRCNTYKQL